MEPGRIANFSRLLILISLILFVLAGFDVHGHGIDELDLIGFGLAFFAAGHLV